MTADVTMNLKIVGLESLRTANKHLAETGSLAKEAGAVTRASGAQILRYIKVNQAFGRELKSLNALKAKRKINDEQYNKALTELHTKMQKKLLTDQNLVKANKELAKREKKAGDEVARTAAKYDHSNRVRAQYLTEVYKLDQALESNAITARVHAQAIDSLDKELKQFHSGLANGANQFARYNMQAYKTAQTFKRRFNTGLQQAGYQVGDFFVQIQSGQSALIALGQQGSQFAGIFGPSGAVIGALLAIGTAIGTIIQQSQGLGGEIKRLERIFKDFSDQLDDVTRYKDILNDSLTTPLSQGAIAARELFKVIAEGSEGKAVQSLSESLGQLKEDTFMSRLRGILGKDTRTGILGEMQRQEEALRVTKPGGARRRGVAPTDEDIRKANILKEAMGEIANAIYVDENTTRPVEEIVDQLLALHEKYSGTSIADAIVKIFEQESSLTDIAMKRITAETDAAEENLELKKKLTQEQEALNKLIEDNNKAEVLTRSWKERDLEILRHKTEGILNEKEIQEKVNLLERDKLKYALQIKLIHTTVIKQRLAQFDEEKKLTAEYKEQLRLAKLQEEAFSVIFGMMEGSAGAKALKKYGGRGFTSDKDPTWGTGENDGKSIHDKPKGKTGKTDLERLLESYDKYIVKLQVTNKIESELVQVFGMERRVQEQLLAAKEKYAALGEKVDYKELERTIRQIEADKQRHKFLEKAIKDRKAKALEEGKAMEDLFKSMEDSFGDALMTIADGTKSVEDSFKTMAHAIIKELYQIFVVKQITGFVSQAAQNYMAGPQQGPTLSGAPLGGNYLKSADGGGYTGNAPRSGGLDGKGGFMAMLHPRETVVDHTKGGSSGVVVNQTINVSTGVQQTVRAEVMGLMPQIAAASKGAVLDAKRRGGAYAGAF